MDQLDGFPATFKCIAIFNHENGFFIPAVAVELTNQTGIQDCKAVLTWFVDNKINSNGSDGLKLFEKKTFYFVPKDMELGNYHDEFDRDQLTEEDAVNTANVMIKSLSLEIMWIDRRGERTHYMLF